MCRLGERRLPLDEPVKTLPAPTTATASPPCPSSAWLTKAEGLYGLWGLWGLPRPSRRSPNRSLSRSRSLSRACAEAWEREIDPLCRAMGEAGVVWAETEAETAEAETVVRFPKPVEDLRTGTSREGGPPILPPTPTPMPPIPPIPPIPLVTSTLCADTEIDSSMSTSTSAPPSALL
ncbi:hypothetical protein B484DRAFT_451558 [Ochromonadaceae sp. CCMP2298]|nr:hypothetical protein B484DRAFT_451558 [Ochromonadaceae sp. CCMP2298]